MGVSGSGKSTVGSALAERIGAPFIDADALHPPTNVDKMAAGMPLTDADRTPWLERIRSELDAHDHVVVACSALKRSYRDLLRGSDDMRFVLLDLDATLAGSRVASRTDHFMPADLVASQFDAMERPHPDEADVITVEAHLPVSVIVERVVGWL
jgi:gluconokinase